MEQKRTVAGGPDARAGGGSVCGTAGPSRCIAVCGSFRKSLFFQLVEGIQEACTPAGYHVLIYGEDTDGNSRSSLLELFRGRKIDGIITLDYPVPLDPEWESEVLSDRIPYVSVDGIPGQSGIHAVQTDYEEAIRQALDFLWKETGLPPLYLNMLPHDREPTDGDLARLKAYKAWMLEQGLRPNIVHTVNEPWETRSMWWREWLSGMDLPLAVLANWSRAAVSFYRAAYERGYRIGPELTVMSADDTERVSRHMIPPIPCIEVPYAEMGRQAFTLLQRIMEASDRAADGIHTAGYAEPADRILVQGKLYRGCPE